MRARALVSLVPLLALASLLLTAPATAASPVAVGWWNLAHQQIQPPPPPDVGAQDLLLQSGPGSPSAFAALRFVVAADAVVGPLVLPLGTSPASRADGVVACPTTKPWQPVQNGRFAEAPTYSCARSVSAVRSEDGKSLVLAGIARLLAEDGTLDFALLPGPSDRVVLAPPPATALTTTSSSSPAPSQPPFEPGPVAAPPSSGGFFPGDPSTALPPANPFLPPPALTPGAQIPPPLAPPLSAPPTTGPPARVAGPVPVASRADDDRTRLLLAAEAILVLAFFGLLGYGPLRRLQKLTGEPLPVAETARGIGRFSSVRSGDHVPHL